MVRCRREVGILGGKVEGFDSPPRLFLSFFLVNV